MGFKATVGRGEFGCRKKMMEKRKRRGRAMKRIKRDRASSLIFLIMSLNSSLFSDRLNIYR